MSHRSTQLAFTFAYIRIHPPRIQIVYHNRLPSKPRSLVPLRCPKVDSSSRCLVMRRPLTIWNSYEFWFLVLRSAFFPLFFFSSVPHALLRTSRPWHVSSHRYLHRTRITHSFGRGHGAYIGVLALPFFFFSLIRSSHSVRTNAHKKRCNVYYTQFFFSSLCWDFENCDGQTDSRQEALCCTGWPAYMRCSIIIGRWRPYVGVMKKATMHKLMGPLFDAAHRRSGSERAAATRP